MDRRAIRRPSIKEITRGLTVAVLATVLTAPAIASAETTHYTQCGSETITSDHTVLVVPKGSNRFKEYDLGKRLGECGNQNAQTSSMVLESVNRSNLSQPDILSKATRPIVCFDGAARFGIQKTSGPDGIDFAPEAGDITEGEKIETKAKTHTDLVHDGSYLLSGILNCETPEGISVPFGDTLNFGISVRP